MACPRRRARRSAGANHNQLRAVARNARAWLSGPAVGGRRRGCARSSSRASGRRATRTRRSRRASTTKRNACSAVPPASAWRCWLRRREQRSRRSSARRTAARLRRRSRPCGARRLGARRSRRAAACPRSWPLPGGRRPPRPERRWPRPAGRAAAAASSCRRSRASRRSSAGRSAGAPAGSGACVISVVVAPGRGLHDGRRDRLAAARRTPGSARCWTWPAAGSRCGMPSGRRRARVGGAAAPARRGARRRAGASAPAAAPGRPPSCAWRSCGRHLLGLLEVAAAPGRAAAASAWPTRSCGPGCAAARPARHRGKRAGDLEPLLLAVGIDAGPVVLQRLQRGSAAPASVRPARPSSADAGATRGGGGAGWRQDCWRGRERDQRAPATANATPRAARRTAVGRDARVAASGRARSLARRLQEFGETGVAVGGRRQVVGEQRGVDLGGGRDLRRCPASAGSGPDPPTSANTGSTDASFSHQPEPARPGPRAPPRPTPTAGGRRGGARGARALAAPARARSAGARSGRRPSSRGALVQPAATRSAKRACSASTRRAAAGVDRC